MFSPLGGAPLQSHDLSNAQLVNRHLRAPRRRTQSVRPAGERRASVQPANAERLSSPRTDPTLQKVSLMSETDREVGGSGRTPVDSDCELKHKFKRKRRRRCKGHPSMKPTLINPTRTSGAAEHPDPTGLEVKENQNHRVQQRYHPTAPRTKQTALKRKQPAGVGGQQVLSAGHPSCKRASWAVSRKNALVQLNELRPGLQYQMVSKTGPVHAPLFSIVVEVNGLHFEGQGPTKQQAKLRAAESALGSFIQFPNASQAHAALASPAHGLVDFTADKVDTPGALLIQFDPPVNENCDEPLPGMNHSRRAGRLTLSLKNSKTQENLPRCTSEPASPVDLLNRLHLGLRYACLVERVHGSPARIFVGVFWVEGRIFEGRGRSKRLAKTRAAATALQALYSITMEAEKKLLGITSCNTATQIPQHFSQAVYHLVTEKYAELTDSWHSTLHARHKALAGVVMTRGFTLPGAQVVALGSGTRCLSGEAHRDQGWAVNDCHAEVIARRALVGFLYTHLELLLCQRVEGVERSVFRESAGGGFRLRDGLLFHMFLSSSPCGDARLHCPYDTAATHLSGKKRRFHCHLRMKTEGGEGTLPVTQQPRANQDGGSQGRPLITMSCTDKMAKWSVLGLQGALLSRLMEPVYLYSVTVGALGHTGHLARTLVRRTARLRHLPAPYRRTQPLLGCLADGDGHPTGRSPNLSLNWSLGDAGLEEVSTSSGRRSGCGTPSRLCQRSLLARWHRLQQQLQAEPSSEDSSSSYSGSKMAAGRYQAARRRFASALRAAGLGPWPGKPPGLGPWPGKPPGLGPRPGEPPGLSV
ncbi:Double-stranded RNA-specific editase B2 [Merluccius polli]|uniref:Double-stranded RNA-specific editase B2 n=1 Tax=Merluccius polli TaxID=89951 RepID=A0AA47MM67_MERPO|nr:Double-stranded RNA-specific editase B2 [Merluccius polli]